MTACITPSSVAAEVMSRQGIRRALVLGKRGVGFARGRSGNRDRVHR